MTLFDQLVGMGYSPQVLRDKVFLDGMAVSDIVDKVPVCYTRRRYGASTTYCWVHAYVGGWFDLGDPHPSVTPRRATVLADIDRLRSKQAMLEAGTANPAN